MKLFARTVMLSLLAAALTGCGREESTTAETIETHDGVPMVYERFGSGDTAVVFVHCWGCGREFWRGQVEPLSGAGFEVVIFDLPGHGDAGAARERWKVADLAADVETLIETLELKRVVLVGHSMGGPVSLLTAPRLRERVVGVGCVDTLHNADFRWPEEMTYMFEKIMREDFHAGIESFLPNLFPPDVDPAIPAWVVEQAVAGDHEALIQLMVSFQELDMPALFKAAGVPIRCINAAPYGPQALVTEIGINRQYADFEAVLMEGVGHYPQLERPEAFNQHLLELLQALEADR